MECMYCVQVVDAFLLIFLIEKTYLHMESRNSNI